MPTKGRGIEKVHGGSEEQISNYRNTYVTPSLSVRALCLPLSVTHTLQAHTDKHVYTPHLSLLLSLFLTSCPFSLCLSSPRLGSVFAVCLPLHLLILTRSQLSRIILLPLFLTPGAGLPGRRSPLRVLA